GLQFHPTEPSDKKLLFEDRTLTIYSIPLKHRIDCTGFLFVEKQRQPKVIKEKIDEYKLQPWQILELKKGIDVITSSGYLLTQSEACTQPDPPRSYAYCSDTAYYEKIAPHIHGVNMLYHESTFLESEKDRAKETFHSTAKQAAAMANLVSAKRLVL